MGQWDRKSKESELRERRREVDALIVLAAAGVWMTVLSVVGFAVITEAMNELQELV